MEEKRNCINIIFLGQPGSGKSTCANGYANEIISQTDISLDGNCVTETMQTTELPGNIIVVDVPGLLSYEKNRLYVKEVTKGLQLPGTCKINFVITLSAKRLKLGALLLIELVCEVVKNIKYGIIVNHEDYNELIVSILKHKFSIAPDYIIFIPYEKSLLDARNVMLSKSSCFLLQQTINNQDSMNIEFTGKIDVMNNKKHKTIFKQLHLRYKTPK